MVEAGDLRRNRAHYGATVMSRSYWKHQGSKIANSVWYTRQILDTVNKNDFLYNVMSYLYNTFNCCFCKGTVFMVTPSIDRFPIVISCVLFFQAQIKENIEHRVTGLSVGNSLVTCEFPAQRSSNAEKVFIWWRHHEHKCFQFIYLFWAYMLSIC